MAQRVDYDLIATTYDRRYAEGAYRDLIEAMRAMVLALRPASALEVGCGTGFWLAVLSDLLPRACGIDYSFQMLRGARAKSCPANLTRATAESLPFRSAAFDLIFCVNAIHHFRDIETFIAEARRILRPGGALAVIGMDPHRGTDRWCVYEFFPETRQLDLARYPSSGRIADAMLRAGFGRVECSVACHLTATRTGHAVLDDPELQRRGCSQMALLSDDQYAAGIALIRAALRRAPQNAQPVFEADISLMLELGIVR